MSQTRCVEMSMGELCRLPLEIFWVTGGGINHGGMIGVVGCCSSTSSSICFQQAISTSDIMFYACFSLRRQERERTSVCFDTDLMIGAWHVNHEGARMTQLCVPLWHRITKNNVSKTSSLQEMRNMAHRWSRTMIANWHGRSFIYILLSHRR